MTTSSSSRFLNAILSRKSSSPEIDRGVVDTRINSRKTRAPATFAHHPALAELRMLQAAARRLNLGDPFFRVHEGAGGAHTVINNREYINFSHYNYLGMNGNPEVCAAAVAAIERYGTSSGASRLVAGERPVQKELEDALGSIYQAEGCVVFVSGHATNVSTIGTLFDREDLIIHDSLVHNSILEGIRAAGATRRPFPHNNLDVLEKILEEQRDKHKNALIVVEGLYSMDGDIPNLPRLIEIKKAYGTFLMVDEAHSLGVLGKTGKGVAEHFDLAPADVDIWMGTLSKTLAACGGYIAGSRDMIDLLKSSAPGFVYSVGISPPLAAAALKSVEIMLREPERVGQLRDNSALFLDMARRAGLNTGTACGNAVIPVIVGSSRKAIELSNKFFAKGINVQPIIHPAVEEKASRLRFFISATHTQSDIEAVFTALSEIRNI